MNKNTVKNPNIVGQLNQCRNCSSELVHSICDLGTQPPSNYYLKLEDMGQVEEFMPLHAKICDKCWLAQLDYFENAEKLFNDDYAYYSSFSTSWLQHSKSYVEMMMQRFNFDNESFIVEIASNDGYLLQYFKEHGVRILGVEPSANVARVAIDKHDIATEIVFFGENTATDIQKNYGQADLILGNNVFAHVPDISDFIAGVPKLLNPNGVVTFEFPSLENLIAKNQFDTIYHEHFSYLSLTSVANIFEKAGLRVFDVERLTTHGGSLRVFGCHVSADYELSQNVAEVLLSEENTGLKDLSVYAAFQQNVNIIKRDLVRFLFDAAEQNKTVVGYGAPAKGNTLLNYAGVRADLLPFTVDRSPQKQGRFLPGTRIPVKSPQDLLDAKPDFVLILPWNLQDEIEEQLKEIRNWGGKFVVPIPKLKVF